MNESRVAASARPSVLVLGGTQFIGRASVAALLSDGGYDVTLLNRGRSRPNPFEGRVATLKADRTDAAAVEAALASRRWDAVIDFIAFAPADLAPIVSRRE